MRIKRFEAESMREALEMVRGEMGPDALILETRDARRRGLFGLLGKSPACVTAVAPERPHRSGATSPSPVVPSPVIPDPVVPSPVVPNPAPVPLSPAGGADSGLEGNVRALREELRRVTSVVGTLVRSAGSSLVARNPEVAVVYDALLEQYVDPELALRIAGEAARRSGGDGPCSAAGVAEAAKDVISGMISVTGPITAPSTTGPITAPSTFPPSVSPSSSFSSKASSSPSAPSASAAGATAGVGSAARARLVVALVGPTGVGKTTTIAKLAAHFSLVESRRVALMTADTYRVAAIEQLRTFAEIIGVPIQVVYAPRDVAAGLARCAGFDVVLVDTAGRNPRNSTYMNELRGFLDAIRPDQLHLTLSATTGTRDLMDACVLFSPLSPDALLFTKLDEAGTLGPILNVAAGSGTPLSYFTTGQNVPDDFEVASADGLAATILGMTGAMAFGGNQTFGRPAAVKGVGAQ